MECQDFGNCESKDAAENAPGIWSDDNEAKKLKEIVSIRSEGSITEEASKQIESAFGKLKKTSLAQCPGTTDSDRLIDAEKNTSNAQEKTELDRRVRIGEITPFQAAEAANISASNSAAGKWGSSQTAGLLGLEHYLKRQAELQEQRKKLKSSKAPKTKETTKESAKTKRKLSVEEPVSLRKKVKSVASTSANDEGPEILDRTHFDGSSTITKQDTEVSETVQKKRSCSPATESQESGSEYVPSDGEIFDYDEEHEKKKTARGAKKKRKKEGKNLESEHSLSKKKIYDDGDEAVYQERMDAKLGAKKKKNSLFTVDNLFKVPKSIWKKLYEYQRVSVRWLWELHGRGLGGLLGDEMGLGKTVQVIAFLAGLDVSDLLSDGERFRGLGPTLIVCPATLLEQWLKHFQDWCPTLRVAILHHSGTFRGEPEYLISSIIRTGGIVLTSYSGVLGHKNLLVECQWHYVILDEGHKIRNPEAKVSKAVKAFSTPHRLLLTGSPMQNSLKELWSLFDFILPGKLGTLGTFLEHCANPITRGGYANASPLQEATALHVATMLKDAIAPYMLRRTKSDVQHHISLPEKNEQVLFCSLTVEQTNLYKDYLRTEHVSSVLHDKSSHSENSYRAKLLVALTTLRKICNHPDLYNFGSLEADIDEELNPSAEAMEKFGDWRRSGKLAVVRSLLKIWKRQGHRVLLFTQGRQMMGVLEALVQREKYEYLRLDGTTPMAQRQHTIHRFNNDPSFFVFVCTTRVGGLGVNLTGANRVVIYDPDWNPAIDAQARERAWRIGQNKRVTIYRLITAGTVEEKIYHRQIFKVLLSNRILENPRQRRLFQTSDLSELFNLNEPIDGKTTESDRIFSNCKLEPGAPNFSQQKIEAMRNLASSVSKKIEKNSKKVGGKEEEVKTKVPSTEEGRSTDLASPGQDPKTDLASPGEMKTDSILPEGELKTDSILPEGELKTDLASPVEMKTDLISPEEELKTDVPPSGPEMETDLMPPEGEVKTSFAASPEAKKKDKRKKKRKRKEHTNFSAESSAIFEGEKVPCLIGRRLGNSSENDHVTSTCDDEYVLMKLFSKSSVSSAYQHDAVLSQAKMGGDSINPMHRMARDAAEESMETLRKSRKWCWKPTWDAPRRNDE